jgi:glycosyltransferase involved in cell wall biosynthesis
MSRFIEQKDLKGVLGLPPTKVRMVRPAPPNDFPRITSEQARLLLPHELQRPFLFYPAAFRPYKNHACLIRALQVLRDELGEDGLDVVFTGRLCRDMPVSLERLADQTNTRHCIHVLGHVERGVLAALYKKAVATLMLSLYEQGSFPVYEALHWKCPVASSDIPSMREQCQVMSDSMLYFDPHDAAALARMICTLRDRRAAILQQQQKAARLLWQRTWKDVAAEWFAVFQEAAASHDLKQTRAA